MTEQFLTPEEVDELAHPEFEEPHPEAEPGDVLGPPTDVPAEGTVDDRDDVVDSNWPDEVLAVDEE